MSVRVHSIHIFTSNNVYNRHEVHRRRVPTVLEHELEKRKGISSGAKAHAVENLQWKKRHHFTMRIRPALRMKNIRVMKRVCPCLPQWKRILCIERCSKADHGLLSLIFPFVNDDEKVSVLFFLSSSVRVHLDLLTGFEIETREASYPEVEIRFQATMKTSISESLLVAYAFDWPWNPHWSIGGDKILRCGHQV